MKKDWRDKFRKWDTVVRPGETPMWKIAQIAMSALSAFSDDQKNGVCNEMSGYQVVVALTALKDILALAHREGI